MSTSPIHPAIVHLPIAFVVMAFVSDLLCKLTRKESLRLVGYWAMIAAVLSASVTVAAGYADLKRASLTAETRQLVELHMKVGWAIAAALVVMTIWRWRIRQQARRVVTTPYLLGSFLLFALTVFQGWYGGEMVYSQGAGVAAAGQGTESPQKGSNRLARVRNTVLKTETAVGAPPTAVQENRGTNGN